MSTTDDPRTGTAETKAPTLGEAIVEAEAVVWQYEGFAARSRELAVNATNGPALNAAAAEWDQRAARMIKIVRMAKAVAECEGEVMAAIKAHRAKGAKK